MKKYVVKPGIRGMFCADVEANEFDVAEPIRSHIDWVYSVPEDGILELPNGDNKDVKKDDLVILFYTAPHCKNQVIVISNDEWKENLKSEKNFEREESGTLCECETCYCDEKVG